MDARCSGIPAVAAGSVAVLTKRPALTPTLLYTRRWAYGPADGAVVWGNTLRFAPATLPRHDAVEGRISGYGDPNERFWRLDAGALTLLDADWRPTSRLDRVSLIDGEPAITGPHLINRGGTHRLLAMPQRLAWPADVLPLRILPRLSDRRRPLLVIFNSMGDPLQWDGFVRWAYRRATADPTIDFLRLAETAQPHSWYLRDETFIRRTLAAAAAGRPRVVLAGNSSGGYAALRSGLWMAEQGLAPDIRTLTVNPQTALSLAHRLRLWSRAWDHLLPASIEDDVLALTGCRDPDLRARPVRRFVRLRHDVWYDADNPAECAHVRRVAGLPGLQTHPVPVGGVHKDGIFAMERHGIMVGAIRAALEAPLSRRQTRAAKRRAEATGALPRMLQE